MAGAVLVEAEPVRLLPFVERQNRIHRLDALGRPVKADPPDMHFVLRQLIIAQQRQPFDRLAHVVVLVLQKQSRHQCLLGAVTR